MRMPSVTVLSMATLSLVTLLSIAGCATNEAYPGLDPAQHEKAALINYQLGIGYMQKGLFGPAEEKLLRSTRMDSSIPEAYNALGVLYEKQDQPALALQNFQQALDLRSGYPLARINYGRLQCSTGDAEQGAKNLNRAMGSTPGNQQQAVILEGLGLCSVVKGDPEQADQYLREALTRNTRLPLALLELSTIALERGDAQEARGYLQRHDKIATSSPRSLFLGYRIERDLGNTSLQDTYALRLRTDFPESSEATLVRDSRQ